MALVTSQNLPYWRNSFWGTSPSYNFRTLSKLHPRSSSVTCLLLVIILILTKSSENIQNHHYSQPHLLTIVDRLGLHGIRLNGVDRLSSSPVVLKPRLLFNECFVCPFMLMVFSLLLHTKTAVTTIPLFYASFDFRFQTCGLLRRGHKNKKRKSVLWRFLSLLLLHFGCGR